MEQKRIRDQKLHVVLLDMIVLNPKHRPYPMKKKLNVRQKLFVVLLDMIVLAELAGCMCWTQQFQESMPSMFLKTYLPIVLVTLIIGKFCLNRLEYRELVVDSPSIEQSR
jgi:hypothetical protein